MIKESLYLEFLDALMKGEKMLCHQIVSKAMSEGMNLKEVYLHILQKALYQIGSMWERGTVSIAEEHIASEIVDYLLNAFMQFDSSKNSNNSVVITCIDKEFHQIGAKMVSNIFELNGWKVYFLGACTPKNDILRIIQEKQPELVGLSFSFYMNYVRLLEVLDNIYSIYPEQKILIGGQGLSGENLLKVETNYPHVRYVKCIDELDAYIGSF